MIVAKKGGQVIVLGWSLVCPLNPLDQLYFMVFLIGHILEVLLDEWRA